MGKYSLKEIEKMTGQKSVQVSDKRGASERRKTNIPADESRKLMENERRSQQESSTNRRGNVQAEESRRIMTREKNLKGGAARRESNADARAVSTEGANVAPSSSGKIPYLRNNDPLQTVTAANKEEAEAGRKKAADSAIAFLKNALYEFPGAKQFARLVNKDSADALANEMADVKEAHPMASAAGNVGGNMAASMMGAQLMNAIPFVGSMTGQAANTVANAVTGGKMSQAAVQEGAKHIQNVLSDAVLDLSMDTLPSMVKAASDGEDVGKVAAESTLRNLAYNARGEMLGMALGSLAKKEKRRIPELGRTGENAAQMADSTGDASRAAVSQADAITGAPEHELSPVNQQLQENLETLTSETQRLRAEADDILNIADAPKKITTMPKSSLTKESKFYTLDKEVSKLVRMYGDESNLDDLDTFRKAITEFETTGSSEAADTASMALDRIDKALQGKTYKQADRLTKSGALKRKGQTYTYGQEYAGINDLVDDAQQQFEDVFNTKGTFAKSETPKAEIPYLNNDTGVRTGKISAANAVPPVANADLKSPSPATALPEPELPANSSTVMADAKIPSLTPANEVQSRNATSGNSNIPFLQENVNGAGAKSSGAVSTIGGKVSKTRTNTMPGTGFLTEEEMATRASESLYKYIPVDEKESLGNAINMIQTEGAANTANRLLQKERLTGTDTDALMALWDSVVKKAQEYDKNGLDSTELWEKSNRIYKKIQVESTNNGQAIQALAKWSRNTPAGMLSEAERIINNKAVKGKEQNALQKLLKKYMKNNSTVEFSADFQKEFLNIANQLQDIGDMDSREAKELMAQLGKMTAAQLPTKLPEKVTAYLMDNMLANFRTLISRNVGGNVGFNAVEQLVTKPVAAGVDRLLALKTGKRTTAGTSARGLSEYLNGFKSGIADEAADFKSGLHTARTGENTLQNAIDSNRHVFKNKIMDTYDNLVKHGLSVGDRPFFEATYSQTMGDLYRLRDKGLLGDVVQGLSDADFEEYAKTASMQNALSAVYQDDSLLSKGMTKLKEGLGDVSKGTLGVDVLSQASMPFVRTPANVVSRGIEYSPFGILKNVANTVYEKGTDAGINQGRLAMETARNLVGTGIVGGGAALAANGIMSGGYSDDKDMKNAQKASGMQEYALDTGDGYFSLDWLPVAGSNLIAGTAAYDKMKENPDAGVLESVGTGAKEGFNQILGQSMFQGMNRVFGGTNSYDFSGGMADNVIEAAKSGVTQVVPSLLRQIAQVGDDYEREVYNSNTDSNINSLKQSIPFLRQTLEKKLDNEGNYVLQNQGRGIGSKIFEDMISPGKYTEKQHSAVNDEAMRLYESTGNNYAFVPTAARNDIKREDGTAATDKQFSAYKKELGELNSTQAAELIRSPYYRALSDEGKEELLQDLYSSMKVVAKKEHLPGYTSDDKVAAVYSEYPELVIPYLKMRNEADYDGNGSRSQKEMRKFLDSEDLSTSQKSYLWQMTNKSWKKNPYK